MHDNLPFPIAFSYHLIGAARNATTRYERLLQCYEAVVRYCATVQISDYLAAACPDPKLNRQLLERLGQPLSLGHWIEWTRLITKLQKQEVFQPFIPEMSRFYFKPGQGESLTRVAKIFNSTLCAVRNDWAHRHETWPEEAFARKFKEQMGPLLEQLLTDLDFLARYTLYVPLRGPRPDLLSEALVLMGPHQPPRLQADLELVLTPAVRARLAYETTAFLVSQEDPARQLLLYPLSLFANCDGTEDIFLFDGCDRHQQGIRRLHYRAVRIGQKPLEVLPGSDLESVVEDFRQMVQSLGPPPAEGPEKVVAAADVSEAYFSIQRKIIEENTRRFVGRVGVPQALDHFLASHRRGYFLLRGAPGQGKTAVACQLIQERGLVHHFCSRGGRSDPRLILRSLLAQLMPLAGLQLSLPDTLPELTKLLEDLLARLAGPRRLLLVIDALDELAPESGQEPPFLVTEALPEGVYVIVTSRPGDRLERLTETLFAVPHAVFDLTPLDTAEVGAILRQRRPDLTDPDIERIADVSQGNPLYLHAVADEMEKNPRFDVRQLPTGIDEFFRRATGPLRDTPHTVLREVLGLLAVARKPLSLRELGQITGVRQRLLHEQGIKPVRQFLLEMEGSYAFYHERFHDFVTRKLLYEDELPDYHRALARWLQRPESHTFDYRWSALAYHLFAAGDRENLPPTIDRTFLTEKVRRFGHAVLEDIELLTRTLLEAGVPALVERCVALVDGLREVVGNEVLEETRHVLQGCRPGFASLRSRVVTPPLPAVPGLDLYVGMLPKIDVGADFFEVIPLPGRLVLAVGDAPGTGLKSAFVARFVANLFRRRVEQARRPSLSAALEEVNRTVAGHDYFEMIPMQCAALDVGAGILTLANAGQPYPVLFSARRGRCDRLPVRGQPLNLLERAGEVSTRYEERRVEIAAGDVLVLLTDGLTEGHRLTGDPYGYRFERLLGALAGRGARAIGEAIIDDWRSHPREGDYGDDVTIAVVTVTP